MLIDPATGRQIIWGFMLENAYFTEFDKANHAIIEKAYSQRKRKQTSHYVVIRDSHLSSPAKIYFGVEQVHLRMPGTRYYVKRALTKPAPQEAMMFSPNRTLSTSSASEFPFDDRLILPDYSNLFQGYSGLNGCYVNLPANSYQYDIEQGSAYALTNGALTSNTNIAWSNLSDPILWHMSHGVFSYAGLKASLPMETNDDLMQAFV
ncbi:hypothetical protein G6F70_004357 [Rhizopus microsporus]|uniref:Uncharacterized protein n=1 Tax=Rhizopus microsporus TaxID=58291 RepID=A0A1X0SCP2_RHIZD|nr:hypothetical protein G6F71_001957 [Rhizopus microsporus]KAG1200067.1 hypothetical protein G6F70_004357 [Rhizopus microsporus]KAG1208648.1 hypothetical protein G6F69_007035 [Rhizopus microsporus]KAG1233711.1 hypothetical protein G6F67_004067 [Rhizopus microsporus]KAG1262048.1 hypothetical protein G6F68_006219 [Rhizopus microsporus]